MKCYLLKDEILSKISVTVNNIDCNNIYLKEFHLKNTTGKDIEKFNILFVFDKSSIILECHSKSKEGVDFQKIERINKTPNTARAYVRCFNRNESINYIIKIANISYNTCRITECNCTGFKIKLKTRK